MEGSDGSPPASMFMVRAAELFPKPSVEREDDKIIVPFTELSGEGVKYLGHTDDGVLALTNYRLFLLKNSTSSETSVPLGLIETSQVRDLFHLLISCKDASTVKCSFSTSEQCSEWHRRITLSVGVPEHLESLFAFPFFIWVSEIQTTSTATLHGGGGDNNEWSGRLQRAGKLNDDFRKEVERLKFDLNGAWRISHVNSEFKLCPSYPRLFLVPSSISDDVLQNVASFRSSRRIPVVVWRHKASGAVIARCSQPEVGWLGWRNSKDEQLLSALSEACGFDRGEQQQEHSQRIRHNSNTSNESAPPSPEGSHEEVNLVEPKKILIVDARSYTSAVTNRARGGGCECPEYYPNAEIQFMSLGNIHAIRKSFHALRNLCASPPDVPNWLGLLERTMWLQHMSGLLAASMVVCHAIERNGRPVLVHCSDGWDRTPQIVATAQLCLDPYYRTVEGFRTLVEREWLSFGHKFADRCGQGPGSDDVNERCPVFLQWLDCVHQIHKQFPCSFEFSMGYLIKLAQHSQSCLFGTFLCNTVKERIENSVFDRTFSVWPFLSGPIYKNPLYVPNREKVLWPAHNVRDLSLWSEVYLGSLGNQNSSDYPPNASDTNQESMNPMIKTRSYGDLISVGGNQGGLARRSSDPSMTVESHILNAQLNMSSDNSIASTASSERGVSPDFMREQEMAIALQDTTLKLQHLTNELKQSDEELENSLLNHKMFEQQQQSTALTSINNIDTKLIMGEPMTYAATNNNNKEIEQPIINSSPFFINYNQEMHKDSIINNSNNSSDNGLQSGIVSDNSNSNRNEYVIKYSGNDYSDCKKNGSNGDIIKDFMSDVDDYDVNGDNFDEPPHHNNDDDDDDNLININNNHDKHMPISNGNNDLMLQSIDLNDSPTQTLWHGSVETSTDTLVPIEQTTQVTNHFDDSDCVDGIQMIKNNLLLNNQFINDERKSSTTTTTTNNNNNIISSNHNHHSNNKINKNLPEVHSNHYGNNKVQQTSLITNKILSTSSMDESIVIQPEFQRMEINGKNDYPSSNSAGINNNNININNISNSNSNNINNNNLPTNRIRRNSSNSKADSSPNKHLNGSISPSVTNSRFSTPGARSLPLTPPGVPDRPPVAISCPDGLAHALSEQNLRLQQIVYEHKIREEALQRELYATRLALLKKTCHNCSNQPTLITEDQDCTQLENELLLLEDIFYNGIVQLENDAVRVIKKAASVGSINDSNLENVSVCSWEAVEDRSAPSSGSNSAQPSNVLWVPDHAVTRCLGCHTEFWLGRRKHHCRSCGQIFCADCSEYWAPVPDERLFTPVRLCGPCYQNITVRMQNRVGGGNNMTISSSTTVSSTTQNHQQQQNLLYLCNQANNATNSFNLQQQQQQQQHQQSVTSSAATSTIQPIYTNNYNNNKNSTIITPVVVSTSTISTLNTPKQPQHLQTTKHLITTSSNSSCSTSAAAAVTSTSTTNNDRGQLKVTTAIN